jgi:superfamily II DNA/RNA helicase
MGKQLAQLHAKPRIIIGTPGRINDHLERKSLRLQNVGFFVLDEFDRMLDIGLGIQVDAIVKYLPKERQTLMFSATLPENILGLSQKYLQNPVRIAVGESNKPIGKIKQETIQVEESEKYGKLISELDQRQGSIIVFVKTKYGAEKLAVKLRKENHSADAIHGDLRQNKRDSVIRAFRDQKYRIMVATDIAARGLDIPHIEHVINYDMPQCPEDYIHRIGRTARAGAEGSAVNLISPLDGTKWRAIHRMLNPGEKLPHMAAGKKASSDKGRGSRGPSRPYGAGSGAGRGGERRFGNSSDGAFAGRSGERRSYGGAEGSTESRGDRRSYNGPSAGRSGEGRGFGNSSDGASAGRGDRRSYNGPSAGRSGEGRGFGNGSAAGAGRGGERRSYNGPSAGRSGGEGRGFGNSSDAASSGRGGERRSYNGPSAGRSGGEGRRSSPGENPAGGFGGERRRSDRPSDNRFGGSPASRSGPSRSGRPGGAPRGNTGGNAGARTGFAGARRSGGSGGKVVA